eukprot:3361568-Ditylum_brightwellii.AAC.1
MTKNSTDDRTPPDDQTIMKHHVHCDGKQKKKKQAKEDKNKKTAKNIDGKNEQNHFMEEEEEPKDAIMAEIKNYMPEMTYYTKQA